jgi:hypothetical protein
MNAGPGTRATPRGGFVVEEGLEWYRIDGYDLLDPFLVTLVTPTDQWMFVSSSGALTAGRRSAGHALFPYETDDRLHRAAGRSGPVTLVRAGGELWEPFASHAPFGSVRRSIAKTVEGDRLRFEEHHPGLGLTFRATWAAADRFGFVRTCELRRNTPGGADVEILDGLLDVLPAGVDLAAQQRTSTLVDAYRRAEIDSVSGAGLFTLEARVTDKPEPAESLRATVVWCRGLHDSVVTLAERDVRRFRSGGPVAAEHLVKGQKAAFLASAATGVTAEDPVRWIMVADVEQSHTDFEELRGWLSAAAAPEAEVAAALDRSRRDLITIVQGADALQESADHCATVHHFANVLFNVMRGGVCLEEHRVALDEVAAFVAARNRVAAERLPALVASLPPVAEIAALKAAVRSDGDLSRLVAEYLPLSFSRRHGDPSRPWNTFDIRGYRSGRWEVGYEGNWRDVFQNWETLLHSYPEYIESVIAKFLNASTVDGFNPYRINDAGVEWEVPEEAAWSNFGYWGDHQIVYLHRLLELSRRFHPGELQDGLDRVWLSYADTPYRLNPYPDIVADPKHTITFDHERLAAIERRIAGVGGDGLLVPGDAGTDVRLASLAEKLFVPVLSKLSNLVAGSGIWMNTQRPEWNDANNALVGNGVSAVTLMHVRDYVVFIDRLLAEATIEKVTIGGAVVGWITELRRVFEDRAAVAAAETVDPADRRALLDALGTAFSGYRSVAYESGPGRPVQVEIESLRGLFEAAMPFLDQAARNARRSDGLVESYWLLHLAEGRAEVEPLEEMLEGQVAALGCCDIGGAGARKLIDAMFESRLYRPDQHTFMLYPNRRIPPFWEKNIVPDAELGPAATTLLESDAGVLRRDRAGRARFDASLESAARLAEALDALESSGTALQAADRAELFDLYESVFHHAAFTGRSGTMYRYEGLGSVYWHMVSKLALALQDWVVRAVEDGEPASLVGDLVDRYRRVRAGLGYQKDVVEQGTFPTDPHSHTPAHTGAQQPGMTGQVKEGVLLRWGELGVRVVAGCVRFRPILLEHAEFLTESRVWHRLDGKETLGAGSLGFTYCGIPVVYHVTHSDAWSRVRWSDGREQQGSEQLDRQTSRAILERRGRIERVDIGVPEKWLVQ